MGSCDTKAGHAGALNCLMVQSMLKHGHLLSKIDQNFTFHLLLQGVTAGWAYTLYGTCTHAGACLMVGSAGSTRLSCCQERQIYIRPQPIMFHFSTNCRMSWLMVLLRTTPLTLYIPIISSSSMHSSL